LSLMFFMEFLSIFKLSLGLLLHIWPCFKFCFNSSCHFFWLISYKDHCSITGCIMYIKESIPYTRELLMSKDILMILDCPRIITSVKRKYINSM
jgi:hypothetical protein